MSYREPLGQDGRAHRSARRCLFGVILTSALAGGSFVGAASLWLQGAKEGYVLFALLLAVVFYVAAESGFGEITLARARQEGRRQMTEGTHLPPA